MLLRKLIHSAVRQLAENSRVGSHNPALSPAFTRMYQQYKQNHTSSACGDVQPAVLFRQVSYLFHVVVRVLIFPDSLCAFLMTSHIRNPENRFTRFVAKCLNCPTEELICIQIYLHDMA